MLLLLANSPSPARAPQQARRGEFTARVLFQDASTPSKSNSSGVGGSGASSSAPASMLLPPPPSPHRRGSISGETTFDPPPVRADPLFGTPGSSGSGMGMSMGMGMGMSASLFPAYPPTTPGTAAKFNFADFVQFTPTPAYPASPVRVSGAAGGPGLGMGLGMPPGAQASPIANVRRASAGEKSRERKEGASLDLDRRTSTEEELGKAKGSPLTSAASVKSVGSDAERPPSSAVSTVAEDR